MSEAVAKQISVTTSACRRPCQLSSVSERALAMMPRNSGITSPMSAKAQLSSSAPLKARKTRRL